MHLSEARLPGRDREMDSGVFPSGPSHSTSTVPLCTTHTQLWRSPVRSSTVLAGYVTCRNDDASLRVIAPPATIRPHARVYCQGQARGSASEASGEVPEEHAGGTWRRSLEAVGGDADDLGSGPLCVSQSPWKRGTERRKVSWCASSRRESSRIASRKQFASIAASSARSAQRSLNAQRSPNLGWGWSQGSALGSGLGLPGLRPGLRSGFSR